MEISGLIFDPSLQMERRIEADEILKMLRSYGRQRLVETLKVDELKFLSDCREPGRVITQSMIFWLRDIHEKFL